MPRAAVGSDAADRRLPITDFAHKAGVVGAADQSAVAALFDVATQRRCPTSLDRRHDAPLDPAEMGVMGASEFLTVAAEDVRHLQCRPRECHSGLRRDLQPQPI
jgi:hypothetical protein